MIDASAVWSSIWQSPLMSMLGWALLHSLWQISLLAMCFAALQRCMRGAAASSRYLALSSALALTLVAPCVTWQLMGPAATSVAPGPELSPSLVSSVPRNPTPEPFESTELANVENGWSPGPADRVGGPAQEQSPFAESETRSPNSSDDVQASPPSTYFSLWQLAASSVESWMSTLAAAWIWGVLLFSLRPILGWRHMRRLRVLGVSAAPEAVQAMFAETARRLGVTRSVCLMQSTMAKTPMLLGHFKPLILLPASLISELPVAQLEAVLAHELAHVRRLDYLVNVAQTLLETIFFYHPAVWWMSAQIRQEREHCCDDDVVAALACPKQYGEALLAISQLQRESNVYAMQAGGSPLLRRIQRLSGMQPTQSAWPSAVSVLLLICCGLTASVWAWQAPAKPAPEAGEFEFLIAEFQNDYAQIPPTRVVIAQDGKVTYKSDALAKIKADVYQAEFQLTAANQEELAQALATTHWLQAPTSDREESPQRNTSYELALIRNGKRHELTLLDDKQAENKAYASLLHFLQRVRRQEDTLRRLQGRNLASRTNALRELGNDLKVLHGRPNQSPHYLPILDWRRFKDALRPALESRARNDGKELAVSLRLFGYLRDPAAWEHIAWHFRNVRLYSKNLSTPVRDAIVDALVAYGDQRSVDLLAEPVSYFWVSAWGLIRCGDIAVPTIVKIIEAGPGDNRDNRFETMFRTYIEQQDQLEGPIDKRVVQAVRDSLADRKVKMFRTKHHLEFLSMIEERRKAPWGPPQAGFSARLLVEGVAHPIGEPIVMQAAIRNRSQRRGLVIRAASAHELEVDGRRYRARNGGGKSSPLNPGAVFDSLRLQLDSNWIDLKSGKALQLSPGAHKVRFHMDVDQFSGKLHQVASNLVQIKVVEKADAKDTSPVNAHRDDSASKSDPDRVDRNTSDGGEKDLALRLESLTPQPTHEIREGQERWSYRWRMRPTATKQNQEWVLRSDLVIRQHQEPRIEVVEGKFHHPAPNSGGASVPILELTVARDTSDDSLHLLASLMPVDAPMSVRLDVEPPQGKAKLKDQSAIFLPASMAPGQSRVVWEGWYADGSSYARHVQYVLSAVPKAEMDKAFETERLQTATRLNGQLGFDAKQLVGEWRLTGKSNQTQTIRFRADRTYKRQGEEASDLKLSFGAWRLDGSTLRLHESSGENHAFSVTDFWLADPRLGQQNVTLQTQQAQQLRLHRLAGDMRQGLKNREIIGTSYGKPVYRDQIRPVGFQLRSELNRLFAGPAMERYRQEHRAAITPSKGELEAMKSVLIESHRKRMQGKYGERLRERLAGYEEQLAQQDLSEEQRRRLEVRKNAAQRQIDPTPNRWGFTAVWIASHWKFQHHLYQEFGGGRVLWQQAGVEAFDAAHRWQQAQEAAGSFKIIDKDLRDEFYAYWTNEAQHRAFLTGDEERIRKNFLVPPWEQVQDKSP